MLFKKGLPYINNDVHNEISVVRSYSFDKIPIWVHIKMETSDALVANNPINITVTTTPINLDEIRQIQFLFEGAGKYFPNDKSSEPPPRPSYDSSQEAWDEYHEETKKYILKSVENIFTNIMFLKSDKNIEDFNIPENYNIPKYSTFSGSLQNLTYTSGGEFDIGITITKGDGEIIGYGTGDTSYMLKEAIDISPPETLLQIENNNIMKGLGWVGISLPFLIAGLNGILNIILSLFQSQIEKKQST